VNNSSSGPCGDLLREEAAEESRHRDVTALVTLGRTPGQNATDLGARSGDVQASTEQVDVGHPQGCQFAPSGAGEREDQDEGPVLRQESGFRRTVTVSPCDSQ
jgi:hypothetical protein